MMEAIAHLLLGLLAGRLAGAVYFGALRRSVEHMGDGAGALALAAAARLVIAAGVIAAAVALGASGAALAGGVAGFVLARHAALSGTLRGRGAGR